MASSKNSKAGGTTGHDKGPERPAILGEEMPSLRQAVYLSSPGPAGVTSRASGTPGGAPCHAPCRSLRSLRSVWDCSVPKRSSLQGRVFVAALSAGLVASSSVAWQAACQGRPRHSKRQPGTGPVMPLAGRSAPPLGLYFWFSLRSSSVGPRVSSGVVKEPLGPTEEELRVGRDKYAALKRRPAAVVVSTTGVYLRAGRLTGPAIHGG
jgi:hypothetical protein